jgi:hypothetical protein
MLTAAYVSSFDSSNEIKARSSPFPRARRVFVSQTAAARKSAGDAAYGESGFDSPLLQ